MSIRSATLVLWLGAAFAAPPGAAQERPATNVLCRFCGNHGEKECRRHRGVLELEREVAFCSVAASCKSCAGALTIDCKICSNPVVEQAAARRRELVAAWLAGRRQETGEYVRSERVVHGKSAHVDLTFSLAPMTVGKRKLDTHRLMHLYLERIESIRRSFCELFALTDRDFPLAGEQVSPRLQIYMLGDPADHRELTPRVTGISAAGAGVKLMGATSVYCMLDDKRILPDDEAVHRNIAHSVAHLLLANALPCAWIGNKKHGWVDEGVAHYFEYRVDGRCSNFCYEEVGLAPGANFAGGRWRVAIRKLVEAGDSRKFTAIYTKNSDQLDFVDHAHAFAYVEFLIARYGGERFADFVRLVKRKTPTRDALRDAFGISLLAFDDAFSEWVRATYPLRAKDRR